MTDVKSSTSSTSNTSSLPSIRTGPNVASEAWFTTSTPNSVNTKNPHVLERQPKWPRSKFTSIESLEKERQKKWLDICKTKRMSHKPLPPLQVNNVKNVLVPAPETPFLACMSFIFCLD